MKYTVYRPAWLRGGESLTRLADEELHVLLAYRDKQASSWLLHPKLEARCCLGHVGKQCGVPDENMRGFSTPGNTTDLDKFPSFLVRTVHDNGHINSAACFNAMRINDNPSISDKERERQLTELFASYGHELEFVGEYFIGEIIHAECA